MAVLRIMEKMRAKLLALLAETEATILLTPARDAFELLLIRFEALYMEAAALSKRAIKPMEYSERFARIKLQLDCNALDTAGKKLCSSIEDFLHEISK